MGYLIFTYKSELLQGGRVKLLGDDNRIYNTGLQYSKPIKNDNNQSLYFINEFNHVAPARTLFFDIKDYHDHTDNDTKDVTPYYLICVESIAPQFLGAENLLPAIKQEEDTQSLQKALKLANEYANKVTAIEKEKNDLVLEIQKLRQDALQTPIWQRWKNNLPALYVPSISPDAYNKIVITGGALALNYVLARLGGIDAMENPNDLLTAKGARFAARVLLANTLYGYVYYLSLNRKETVTVPEIKNKKNKKNKK